MNTSRSNSFITSPLQIVSLAAIGVIGNLAPFIMPVIVGGVVDHLGVSLAEAGYVAFADMFGLGVGALVWSRLISSANWRNYGLLAVTLVVAGNVACTMISSLPPLMAARVAVGLGSGLLLAIGNSGLTMTRDPDRTIGIVTVVAMLSASLALFVFPLLVAAQGVDAMFYAMAAATAIAGLGVFGMPRRSPKAADPDGHAERDLEASADATITSTGTGITRMGVTRMGVTRTGVVALVGVFLFFVGAIVFWVYVERLGNDAGFSVETIASVLGVSHLFGALGAITPAVLSTRLGNRMIPITFCIGLAFVVSILMAADPGVAVFAFAACAFIFAWDCFYPYMMGLLITIDPSGRLVSNGLAVQTVGKAVGPAVAGALILQIGFTGVYALCALLFVLSLIAFWTPIAESDRLLKAAQA